MPERIRVAVPGKVLERNVGGNTTYTQTLYARLAGLGVDARVLVPPGRSFGGSARKLSHAMAEGVVWPRTTGPYRADLLHFTADTGALLRARVPVAATIHGVPPRRPVSVRRALWERTWHARVARLSHLADAVITVSEFSAREIHRTFGVPERRVHVIPHGVDTARFHQDRSQDADLLASLSLPERFVLFLGTLDPRKNVPLLVDAMAHGAISRLGVPLVVAGVPCVGSERIERLLVTAPHVYFLGAVPAELVAPLLRAAAAFVFPSSHEGFGLPVVEAMACGTPVIVSDRGALPEVSGGAALVAAPLTVASLASEIREVLSDGTLAADLRRHGLINAQRFTWAQSARRHREVFAELLSGAAAR
jgi:glycosyltransferase involved in cell wall biosynthesis